MVGQSSRVSIPVAWTFMSEFSPKHVTLATDPTATVIFVTTSLQSGTTDMNVHPTSKPRLVMIRQCKRISRNWLCDGSGPNESDRNSSGHHGTIFDDLDFLQILTVNAFADSGRLASVTAEILCLAAFNLLVAPAWFQVAVQLELSCTLDAFIFLQGTHGTKQFLIRRLGHSQRKGRRIIGYPYQFN